MRIDGEWSPCDDGIVRPVIWGEILTRNGSWESAEFLLLAQRHQYSIEHR